MIKPTVGRVVWFFPSLMVGTSGFAPPDEGQPLAGIVARVWNDRLVNLTVFDANGVAHARTSVVLVQEGDKAPESGHYAEWMPYQVGQAKKHEPQPPVDNAHVAKSCEQFSAADIAANARPPHQQRVIDERFDLANRLDKLTAFFDMPLFANVDGAEQSRLRQQHHAMTCYAAILDERIAAF